MIQNVVLGILCILLIALAFMFNKEKNASKERAELLEKQLSEEVKKHRKELAEVQLGLQKSLSASAEDTRKALEKNAEAGTQGHGVRRPEAPAPVPDTGSLCGRGAP